MNPSASQRQDPAPAHLRSRSRLGGVSSIIAGILFLIRPVLDLIAGDPPPGGAQLSAWVTSHHLELALANETLALGAVLLIPVALALYRRLDAARRPWTAFGCVALIVAVPVLLMLVVVHGRLVYPVYGIDVDDPATTALVISVYHGGMHLVGLLLAAALIMIALAMRHGPARRTGAIVGIVAGTSQIVGAYPWLIGPVLAAATSAMFAAWLCYVGVTLLTPSAEAHPAAR